MMLHTFRAATAGLMALMALTWMASSSSWAQSKELGKAKGNPQGVRLVGFDYAKGKVVEQLPGETDPAFFVRSGDLFAHLAKQRVQIAKDWPVSQLDAQLKHLQFRKQRFDGEIAALRRSLLESDRGKRTIEYEIEKHEGFRKAVEEAIRERLTGKAVMLKEGPEPKHKEQDAKEGLVRHKEALARQIVQLREQYAKLENVVKDNEKLAREASEAKPPMLTSVLEYSRIAQQARTMRGELLSEIGHLEKERATVEAKLRSLR